MKGRKNLFNSKQAEATKGESLGWLTPGGQPLSLFLCKKVAGGDDGIRELGFTLSNAKTNKQTKTHHERCLCSMA